VALALGLALCGSAQERARGTKTDWPAREWAQSTPEKVALDQGTLAALDADLKSGKYPLVDSFAVFRCGKEVFARKYTHDYAQIYRNEATNRALQLF
jgi:hypothetical protein